MRARCAPEQILLLGVALFSAAALAGALLSQYGFGLHPCDLCIKQRIPYALLVVLGLGALWLRPRKTLRLAAWGAALLMLIETLIAWYHTGVEKGVFKAPDGCSGGDSAGATLEELRRQIMEAPLVSCAQAMTEWMGLSMAAWNGIVSLAVLILMLGVLWRTRV